MGAKLTLIHDSRVMSGSDLGKVEQEGVAGEVQQVGSSLADADVAQYPQPALVPLLLRLLCAESAHCPRQQEHLLSNLQDIDPLFLELPQPRIWPTSGTLTV